MAMAFLTALDLVFFTLETIAVLVFPVE